MNTRERFRICTSPASLILWQEAWPKTGHRREVSRNAELWQRGVVNGFLSTNLVESSCWR